MIFLGILIFIVLAVFIKLKTPVWKGKFSERLVSDKLWKLPDEYISFNNLLFISNGRSTQIDHIIVSPYAIFVIETKGYKGWILGSENAEYWTQCIYKNKYQFYNPIWQNEGHIRFLRHLLKCSDNTPFVSIVVFNNDANLKVHTPSHNVINRCDLLWTISQYQNPILSQDNIDWIINTIKQTRSDSNKENLKRHKQNAYSQLYRNKSRINQGICPKCGGKLILRTGKFGAFYGCSNYPNCKFTLNT